jgi:endonuclease YncB( thermonuclease family)
MRFFRLAVLVFALGALVAMPQVGDAKTKNWATHYGTVVAVVDGDTLDVRFSNGVVRTIRYYGMDTNEWGACLGPEATSRMKQLAPPGTKVVMEGDLTLPLDAHGRETMRVFVADVDLAGVMLAEGLAISRTSTELSKDVNRLYRKKTRIAQVAGIGIWNPRTCGAGPDQSTPIRLRVMYEADGPDEENLSGEWVEIHNDGTKTLNLSGWMLREASRSHLFFFPSGTSVAPGGSVRVVGGTGSGGGVFHWGNSISHLERKGDGVYLLDLDGDIRAYVEFPCVVKCGDPLKGKVAMSVRYDAEGNDRQNINGEWIDIWNVSGSDVNLRDYVIERDTHAYHFEDRTIVPPGEFIRVRVGSGTNRELDRYWGKDRPIFGNLTGRVVLRTLDGRVVAKYAWPCDPCGNSPDVRIQFVNADAPGIDSQNTNGEFLDLKNWSDSKVVFTGWSLVTGSKQYQFKDGFTLAAGGQARLYVGSGTDSAHTIYWGRSVPAFNNDSDTVELRTAFNDLAHCFGWGGSPCDLPDRPLPISFTVDYKGAAPNDESFGIHNDGSSAIGMKDFKLVYKGHVYEFPDGFSLAGQSSVTLFVGNGTDTASSLYWGQSGTLITQTGIVWIHDRNGSLVASESW